MIEISERERANPKHVLLLNQHGTMDFGALEDALVEGLIEAVAEDADVSIQEGRELLLRYIRTFGDFGANELTAAIKKNLNSTGVDVTQIDVPLPRGIIDTNRINPNIGVYRFFQAYPENTGDLTKPEWVQRTELRRRLAEMHQEAVNEILAEIKRLKLELDLVLDVHTMKLHDGVDLETGKPLTRAITPEPGKLGLFTKYYNHRAARGRRRTTDLITGHDGDNMNLTKAEIAIAAEAALHEVGYNFERNYPYYSIDGITAPELSKASGGKFLAIDVPRNQLAVEALNEWMYYDYSNLKPAPGSIDLRAQAISHMVRRVVA